MEDVFKIKTVNHTYGEVYVNAPLDRESVDRYLLKVRQQSTCSNDILHNIINICGNIALTHNNHNHVSISSLSTNTLTDYESHVIHIKYIDFYDIIVM